MPRQLRLAITATVAAGAIAAPAQGAVTRSVVSAASADNNPGATLLSVDAAPDGTTAATFLKKVGGVDHVFLARGTGGVLGAATQIDTGGAVTNPATPSGMPVVAVANGGKAFVAFPNGTAPNEKLYRVTVSGPGAAPSAPAFIDDNPAGWGGLQIDLAGNGDGYLGAIAQFQLHAFKISGAATTSQVGGGTPSAILNADPTHQVTAGDQTGEHLAVDPSGATATLAWSEPSATPGVNSMWARKLSGAAAAGVGTAVAAEIPTLNGRPADGGANDMSSVATGGGQTYVAFREFFTYPKDTGGTTNLPRLLVRSFDGTAYGPAKVIDSLGTDPRGGTPPTQEGAEVPRLALNSTGQGIAGGQRQFDFGTETATRAPGGDWTPTGLVSGFPTSKAPGPGMPAITEQGVGFIGAFNQPAPGSEQAVGQIFGGTATGIESTLSDAAAGAVSTVSPAAAGGDFAVIAFRQGTGATASVTVAKVDLPPTPKPTPAPGDDISHSSPEVEPDPPAFTNLKLSSSKIKRSDAKPIVLSSKAKGPYLEFKVSSASRIAIFAERISTGRKDAKGKCVKQTKSNAKRKRCTRYTATGKALVLDRPAGTTRIRFTGRLGGKHALPAGKYRLGLTAADAKTGALTSIKHLTVTLR